MKQLQLFALALISVTAVCQDQNSMSPDQRAMIQAEQAFIDMARTQNRRDAFLFFLSDSAVTQGPKGPIKGKEALRKQAVNNDLLRWHISRSLISSSQDFGYNSGPWEYFARRSDEKPGGYGEFNSIWKKLPDGTWKILLDIGISYPTPGKDTSRTVLSFIGGSQKAKRSKANANELVSAENKFQSALKTDRVSAYQYVVSPYTQLMHSGHAPYRNLDSVNDYVQHCPKTTNHVIMGYGQSGSNDLGYVYGVADVALPSDGNTVIKKGTFVRIWTTLHSKNPEKWTLALDLLAY